MSTAAPAIRTQCSYCGLTFGGRGYGACDGRVYCCYGCHLVERIVGASGEEGIASWLLVRLGVGAFLAMNVMMISLVLYTNSSADLGLPIVQGLRWGMLILSTPAMVILGAPFLLSAAKDARAGRLATDALIATGAFAAYGVSLASTVQSSGQVYFDTATMLLLIVTLGRLLEAAAKHKTSNAIRDLMNLTPGTARVVRNGREVEIPSTDVCSGDLMIVKPGERLPADGRIVSGECLVEESAFTGESRPRSCSPGTTVFGGSVNLDGSIKVEATSVGSDSLVCRIQAMVARAQNDVAPIERLTDRITSVFVPVVWSMSLFAFVFWSFAPRYEGQSWLSALAVLVVACPCALGLATPMATCLAIARAAREGVLIRSGDVLERLPKIGVMFLDKTGTLTENRLKVKAVEPLSKGTTADEALMWAASLETAGSHTVGRAIVDAARDLELELGLADEVKVIPGKGIAGSVTIGRQTRRITLGSLRLFPEEAGISDDDSLTTTYVAWDGQLRAKILFEDTQSTTAARLVNELKARGIRPMIISGDRHPPTLRLADQLGVDAVLAEHSPADKSLAVRKARESGRSVAMVGDGINDAPALAEANVGIAAAGGTDLAKESSDVTLLGDDLTRIPWVLDLAKHTYRIIRQNLWWAFGYNSLAIVLAFFGYVHPLIAASAMVLSSLAVISNSMRVLKTR